MTAQIFTENEQMFHGSTFRPSIPEALLDKDESDSPEKFMAKVYQLRSQVLPRELEDIVLENTPQ